MKTLINNPVEDIFFDECVPSRNQIEQGKGWKVNEESRYSDALKSLGRNKKIPKTFLGNPNDTYYNCWFLKHWQTELEEKSKWYWKNRPKNQEEWNKWTWKIELEKDNKLLYLEKLEYVPDEFDSYEENNWDIFFTTSENLRIIEPINGSTPLYVFDKMICYLAKKGFWYFAKKNDPRLSKKEEFHLLPEYCIDKYQRFHSQQTRKKDIDKNWLREDLLRKKEQNRLWFASAEAKERIETFIAEGKTE